MHTDLRVQEDGPERRLVGIGRPGGSANGLFAGHGVTPQTRVLDFGCGTGRLARVLVPYLAPQHYTGIDLSMHALVALQQLAWQEGWEQHGFTLHSGDGTLKAVAGEQYDVILAYAVFIHFRRRVKAIIQSLQAVQFGRLVLLVQTRCRADTHGVQAVRLSAGLVYQDAQRYGYRVTAVERKAPCPPTLGSADMPT